MSFPTGQSQDMNQFIIELIGIIRIQEDLDSRVQVMKIEKDGTIRVLLPDIIEE